MVPRYQITFAREAQFPSTLGSGMLPETQKIIDFATLTVACTMQGKQSIYYTLATFYRCHSHPNIDILGTQSQQLGRHGTR